MSKAKLTWAICLLIVFLGISGCQSSPPKNSPAPTETTKKEASQAKTSFSKILGEYNTLSDTFQSYLGDMTSGDVDLELYKSNLAKLHNQATDLLNKTKSLETAPQYQEAKEMLVTTVTLLDQSVNEVLKYFESKQKNQLSLAQEEFKQAKRAAYLAQTTLDKQAANDGYKE
ncbi:MAG: hypothetical protein GX434_18710 [Peptococcaceae bacterium]|nr:hypothetical protein [Peptococcaceae bacterium]